MAKNELSPELRILLAFALSFVILLVSRPLLVRQTPPAPATKPASPSAGDSATPQAPAENSDEKTESSKPALTAVPAEPTAGEAEEEVTVEGDLYRVVLSTRGAVVRSWTLKNFKDQQKNPLELVNPEAASRYGDPLSVWVADEAVRKDVNGALFVPSAKGDLKAPVTLTFEYSGGRVAARKQFVFSAASYAAELESDLATDGKPVPHELAWRGSFGDIHDAGVRGTGWDVFYRQPDQMVRIAAGKVEGESSTASGAFAFAGIEDHFFAAAFVPPQDGLRVTAFRDEITLPGQTAATPSIGVAVGSGSAPANRLKLFVGPKRSDILAPIQTNLPELIDYGWFAFVAKPLFLALRWIYDHVVANYGWAIILLTVVINMVLFPLKITSLRSARKMQQLQPQLRAIQQKYKSKKLKDRNEMSQETMALYKKHGVNPLGGCLPMLLQIPFLYGFYKVLLISIEMRQAPWISWWVPDLSVAEPHWFKLLPLLMCGTQFVMQKMTPTPSTDPTQQKIMLFMPVMMLAFFYYISSGLVLYWLTGNVVGIAQQWYINRTELKHEVEEKRAAAAKKKRK
ncbi:MAG: membrane protein insertase YidC [Acidobacteria bacterium]|nr:membrane protein insertase YidC [Acidobacteriota bacterium]